MESGYPWVEDKNVTKEDLWLTLIPKPSLRRKTIAVVGASNDPEKYNNEVASYLIEQGYRIIPVNPTDEEVLGERTYETVDQILGEVDVVDVFLAPEKTPEIAEDAVQAGAKVLWLQEGIENGETCRIAEEGELAYVEGRCMKKPKRD
jgi:predicted CoA-binding protein